jgi:hypothetical protein
VRKSSSFGIAVVAAIAALYPGMSFAQPKHSGGGYGSRSWWLCGHYSLNFAGVTEPSPVGYIAGSGELTSDCQGNLNGVETTNTDGTVCQNTLSGTYTINSNGTGTDSLTLTPLDPSVDCPTVTFTEAIALGNGGQVVKAINSTKALVTTYEEWIHQ